MSQDSTQEPRPRIKKRDEGVAWILIAILGGIALASFVLKGQAQSTAITAVLAVGLAGIVVTMLRSKK